MDGIHVTFAGDAGTGVPAMMEGCSAVSRAGLVISGVEKLTLRDVSVKGCKGDERIFRGIGQIIE
jgi:hypothetical protein